MSNDQQKRMKDGQHDQHKDRKVGGAGLAPVHDKRFMKKEYQQLFVSFVFMILLTILAFVAIRSTEIGPGFAIPFIMVLAAIQVVLQLFIFMHLKEKGSGFYILFMGAGLVFGIVTLAALIHLRVCC